MASTSAPALYEKMFLIRAFEERVRELFAKGDLSGTTHPCVGQEATAVGVVAALEPGDIVTSTHRGHGHFLAYTDDPDGLMAELMGKATGVCGGRGGSQHLHADGFYTNGITGGMAAVGTGMAFAEKLAGSGRLVASFLGEGALAQGVVCEAMNLAALWELPILYALENNLYAMSTRIEKSLAGGVLDRARALAMECRSIEVDDVMAVRAAAADACHVVREQSRPFLLEMKTYRFQGHSLNDDCSYRDRDEEAEWLGRDPLARLGNRLDAGERAAIEQRCHERIERAIAAAHAAPEQDQADIGAALWQA